LDAAIFKELGWGGIDSVFVTSQICVMHTTLRMPNWRLPKLALLHSITSVTDAVASGALRLMRQNGVAPAALGFQKPNALASASLETIRRCCGEDFRDKITKTKIPETKGHVNKHFKPDALAEVAAVTQEKVLDNGNGHRA
jgi:hypothetical protein